MRPSGTVRAYMIPYRRILIATDGSENVGPAIAQGLWMAKVFHAEVTALCVTDTSNPSTGREGPPRSRLRRSSEAAVRDVVEHGEAMGVSVTPLVKEGAPAKVIIAQARQHDLVVMGTVGRTGLSHLLLGSVAEKVVRESATPVLVVRAVAPLE